MRLKKINIVFIAICAMYLAEVNVACAANYPTDVVRDMALIYQGGTHRPEWTEEELLPYVTHTFADGHIDWFFDSFLFFEFTDNGRVGFGDKYGKQNAKRTDWEWLLNRIFEKGKSLDALNSCIEHNKSQIGTPTSKHKIVLGVVSPITDQNDWGVLAGKTLNFAYQSDQIMAAKWYIDQLIQRFNECAYNNIELIGFYWIEESTAKCGDLPKYINKYIHQLGKRAYWIPYWCSPGYDEWKELGFDTAFLQPNHFFNTTVIDARLSDACRLAKQLGMGIEMEFDSKVLYENPDSYYNRLETYINAFEKYSVFEKSPIAYYSGTKAILDMYHSKAIENTIILDKIANHIVERRNSISGIETPQYSPSDFMVLGGIGEIYVLGTPQSIKVFTLTGMLISENLKRTPCSPGIYMVKIDGFTKKIVVQ